MNPLDQSDPIVAIATPPGKGGVGVVRFSFPKSYQFNVFVEAFIRKPIEPRVALFVRLKDQQGHFIDEGLALRFDAPSSYTGEYVLEFQGHGGQAVLQAVIHHAFEVSKSIQISLRYANPGEFTQRAFLNDKLDLAQAEAVADLIDAESIGSAKAAAASLSGVFSSQVNALSEAIVHLRLLLEATLDFPEEEIEFLEKANAKGQLEAILNLHRDLLASARDGLKFKNGLRLVIAGRPNVGKSSLLNALCGEEVAIVTDIAGTTRDKIEQSLTLRGVPLVIIDTAGLRNTDDIVEQIGIERARAEIQKADLVLYLRDNNEADELPVETPEVARAKLLSLGIQINDSLVVQSVINKVDLLSDEVVLPHHVLGVSAKTGEGLEALKDKIFQLVGMSQVSVEHGFMARERHVLALQASGKHLSLAAEFAQQDDRILDLFAEELRLAHDCLGEITGRMLPDDLLGLIFSRFCIGK